MYAGLAPPEEGPVTGGPGRIRTSEAEATGLQPVPFVHSGTDPAREGRIATLPNLPGMGVPASRHALGPRSVDAHRRPARSARPRPALAGVGPRSADPRHRGGGAAGPPVAAASH